MSKKVRRNLISGIAIITVVALLIGTVGIAINIQFPKKEKALSFRQRQVLIENFTPVDLTSKKEPKRVIDNKNPLNLLNYYGDEPVLKRNSPKSTNIFTV